MSWDKSERTLLKKLNSFEKIQNYLDELEYNDSDACLSPRYTMLSQDGHCFEGALLAAAALEYQGHPPLVVDLMCLDFDDPHVITVFKHKKFWGSIGKSSTTLLMGRSPVYRSVRELVMSYFDFYFDKRGKKSLVSFSRPINLNSYNHLHWRTTEANLMDMGISFNQVKHHKIINNSELLKFAPANKKIVQSCFFNS